MSNASPPPIVGSGIAGLSAALALAPRPVIVLTSKGIGEESSSLLAQGGIAAAFGPNDSPELHAQDTLAAGAGICDPATVEMVTEAAPAAIRQLIDWGVNFDKDEKGKLDLCLEGGHSQRRIAHADGDSTGPTITRALAAKVLKTPSITLINNAKVMAVNVNDQGVTGVTFVHNGVSQAIETDNVILATGGIGALWPHTTNPHGSWGQGLLLAARAGASLRDLEFVQFHPTGIDAGLDPMPLASESLRGEGARLVNDCGDYFMNGTAMAELAPRDIVARDIWKQLQQGRRVFLDARMIPDFARRFPTINNLCLKAGLDPMREPIPVRPAAHYHMGGVAVDSHGRTSVNGLWACGEVAATGLHGANRLASNSLLEAVVFGKRIAEALATAAACTHPLLSAEPLAKDEEEGKGGRANDPAVQTAVRSIMAEHVGVLRNKTGLEKAVEQLTQLAQHSDMAAVALMIATAALHREESLGAHCRTDCDAIAARVLPARAGMNAGADACLATVKESRL